MIRGFGRWILISRPIRAQEKEKVSGAFLTPFTCPGKFLAGKLKCGVGANSELFDPVDLDSRSRLAEEIEMQRFYMFVRDRVFYQIVHTELTVLL